MKLSVYTHKKITCGKYTLLHMKLLVARFRCVHILISGKLKLSVYTLKI